MKPGSEEEESSFKARYLRKVMERRRALLGSNQKEKESDRKGRKMREVVNRG